MKRLFTILTLLFTTLTATAQIENSIVLDRSTFRAVQTDALTGVNIDPIGLDHSRQACARVKIKFDRMSKAQIDALDVKMRSNTDLTKQKVADYYDNVLILEMTAKPNTRFYLYSPEFGESNEVTLNLEGNREYEMLASLNQTYSIVVNSNVANADVYIDGVFKGKTDASNSLTIKDVIIGGHRLKLTYGNVSAEQDIVVNDGSISFRQNLNTAANEPQFVVFTVEPQSAVVIIDNQHYTLSDGAMSIVLDGGSYNYTVTAAGYHPQSGTFTVAGSKVVKDIRLKADAATVTLTAPDNAEIWVNGAMKGRSSWSGTLNSGTYIFEARKAGHKSATLSKHITSSESVQRYTLPAPTPIFGWLVVLGTPINADVTLDGKAVGQLPLKLGDILVGKHTVVVSKSGYETYTQSVTIAEGKTITVNVALKKQTTSPLKGVTPIEIDSSLTASQLEAKADEYYDKKDYNSAVQYYHKAAQAGKAFSQLRIGFCYDKGFGVTQDYYEAAKWYRKAAEQGNAYAQHNLGVCYDKGRGVTQDYYEAVKWYRKAAEQGNANAQCNLGVCYENGRGVTKSITEAAKWYRKAAEQGEANAQFNLGVYYELGQGVTQDYAEAAKWYHKAAENGHTIAQYNVGVCYQLGQGVTKSITEAVKWYRKSAEQGYARAKDALRRLGY
ncbi:MAG: SEL1-like repeat protein [Alistipes sp.]|nr:SEL1-like repeat protein [Alistipes sp.]